MRNRGNMRVSQRILCEMTPDALDVYLAEIRCKPVLTSEEEAALKRRIYEGDEQARQELVERNLRFVVWIAKTYQGHGLPLSDLINEGNLGLLHAARKFDPRRDTRFLTYAVWWIRRTIDHALADGSRAVHLSMKQAESLSRLHRKFREMHQQKGTKPTADELALALEMKPETVTDLLRVSRAPLSLDAPMQGESGATRLDVLQSSHIPSSEEIYFQFSMVKEVRELLAHLDPRDAKILRARFGFESKPKSLATIGQELGISSERVRQLEARACSKLCTLAKKKTLHHYLN